MTYNYEFIVCEKIGKVLKINLNRTKFHNALNPKMRSEIFAAFDEGDNDSEVACMVLAGNGRSFCSGADISTEPGEKSPLDPEAFSSTGDFFGVWVTADDRGVEQQRHILKLKKPVIAAVHGYCMGVGMWLAMACDMTYCTEDTVFSQNEVRHSSNSSFLIPALVGWKHASRWLLTGDRFDGKEAARIGLVNECVPNDKLMDTVLYVADRIAKVPVHSVRHMKRMIMAGFLAYGLSAAFEVCVSQSSLGHCSHGPERQAMFDAQEQKGLKGFIELRDDPFKPEIMIPRSEDK